MQQAAPNSRRRVKFSTNAARTASKPGLTYPVIAGLLLLDTTLLLFIAPSTAKAGWFLTPAYRRTRLSPAGPWRRHRLPSSSHSPQNRPLVSIGREGLLPGPAPARSG